MKVYTDADASLKPLTGKTAAILGYGNQGRAQTLNLRDSGVTVLVGNRQDTYLDQARADGFEPTPILEAAQAADLLFILTTDESQPEIWDAQIAPGLARKGAFTCAITLPIRTSANHADRSRPVPPEGSLCLRRRYTAGVSLARPCYILSAP